MDERGHISDIICQCCNKLKNADGTCPTGCNIPQEEITIPLTVEEE